MKTALSKTSYVFIQSLENSTKCLYIFSILARKHQIIHVQFGEMDFRSHFPDYRCTQSNFGLRMLSSRPLGTIRAFVGSVDDSSVLSFRPRVY